MTLCADGVTAVDQRRAKVLEDVSALFQSGRLTAVVNCCGTQSAFHLLSALAGLEETQSGLIVLNGTPVTALSYRRQAVLLDEDFAAFDALTVRENLEFAVRMRVDTASRPYSVDLILEHLSLTSVQHSIVRTCSLYVRRRVSLGKELLCNPSVLLLDQPLQGLATHEAQQFLSILRKIASPAAADAEIQRMNGGQLTSNDLRYTPRHNCTVSPAVGMEPPSTPAAAITSVPVEGHLNTAADRIVVFSVVQPRWTLLKNADDVVLLEGHRCLYWGPMADVLSVPLPTTDTVPHAATQEGFVHTLYRLAMSPSSAGGTATTTREDPSATGSEGVAAAQESALSEAFRPLQHRQRKAIARYMRTCAAGQQTLQGRDYDAPGTLVHLVYLFQYSLLQIRHSAIRTGALLVIAVGCAVALTALYGQQEGQTGMQNRVGIIFFLVSCVLLQCILSLGSVRRDYVCFQRHRAHGYYNTFTFLVYTVITCAVRRFFLASSFALVIYLLSNFGQPWGEYPPIFELSVIVAITSFCSYFVVLLACSALWTLRATTLFLYALYTVNIILAGLILNLPSLPPAVQALSFLTVLRLSYESCILTQFTGRLFGCDEPKARGLAGGEKLFSNATAGDVSALPVTCYTGTEYAKFIGFNESRRWTNVAALSGMSGVLILCCFAVMVIQRPRRLEY